ncbi:MAG: response regulator [Cyclobacteriaceae bacterium]
MDIVCIEDNVDFCFFMEKALSSLGWDDVKVEMYSEGAKALEDLSELTKRKNSPKLVLLDINMPGMDGMTILKSMRENYSLKNIPVVMLSSSDHPDDINNSYLLGANGYLVKPQGYKAVKNLLEDICCYWVNQNQTVVA